jgi:lysozyme family protein
MTEEAIIAEIIEREGGFVSDPVDRGGPTKFGITQRTLAEWRGRPVSADEVRAILPAEAAQIYRERYLRGPGFHKVENDHVRALLVDCAVLHGPRKAVILAQRAVGFPLREQDGVLGPKTLAALEEINARAAHAGICAQRAREFGRIISSDPAQARFAAGWLNRLAVFIEDGAAVA